MVEAVLYHSVHNWQISAKLVTYLLYNKHTIQQVIFAAENFRGYLSTVDFANYLNFEDLLDCRRILYYK